MALLVGIGYGPVHEREASTSSPEEGRSSVSPDNSADTEAILVKASVLAE